MKTHILTGCVHAACAAGRFGSDSETVHLHMSDKAAEVGRAARLLKVADLSLLELLHGQVCCIRRCVTDYTDCWSSAEDARLHACTAESLRSNVREDFRRSCCMKKPHYQAVRMGTCGVI